MRRVLCAVSVGLSALVSVQAAASGSPVTAAPDDFTDEVVADVGSLTTVEALPDGRVIVLEKGGRVIRIDDRTGAGQVTEMARFGDLCTNSERGLLGFTTDPAFLTSGFVYVYRTIASGEPGGCHNRVSRFEMDEGGLDLGSERVLVDRISSVNGNHNGGDVEIGNDGFLYIATGDAGRDPRGDSGSAGRNDAAQDRSLLNGKILRVERSSGVAAPGNPFIGVGSADCRLRGNSAATPTSVCNEIFAYGLRNPYRFAFDPNTSATRFFINDVGQGDREEVNESQLGANYGWPAREGRCPQGQNPPCGGPSFGLTDPITDYGHGAGLFITGGAFVPDGVWPATYDGAYLASDGAFGTTWAYRDEQVLSDAEVFLDARAPTDMTFVSSAAGTALWYVQQNGEVHKVSHDTPVAPADSGPLQYIALDSPDRRFDSRALSPAAPLRGGQTRLIGLDAPAGAEAALVNVTIARPQTVGAFVTAYEPRTQRPGTATANAARGDVVANASIVPLDSDGNVLVFAQVTTDLIIDVAGFYVGADDAVASGRFTASGVQRLVDTRQPVSDQNPFTSQPDGTGTTVNIPVAGRQALPGVGDIGAVALVVTGIQSDGPPAGFITVSPGGVERPTSSNVNVNPGTDTRANLVVVPVGADGSVDLYLERVRDVAVDVVGYVTSGTAEPGTGGRLHLVAPTREVDTRTDLGFSRFEGREVARPDFDSVPDSASAVVQNLTMVRTGGRGFVSVQPIPQVAEVSSVNSSGSGQTRGALNIGSFGEFGQAFTSSVPTDLTVDVLGWFE